MECSPSCRRELLVVPDKLPVAPLTATMLRIELSPAPHANRSMVGLACADVNDIVVAIMSVHSNTRAATIFHHSLSGLGGSFEVRCSNG